MNISEIKQKYSIEINANRYYVQFFSGFSAILRKMRKSNIDFLYH